MKKENIQKKIKKRKLQFEKALKILNFLIAAQTLLGISQRNLQVASVRSKDFYLKTINENEEVKC